jgi:shikimate dehydrogenase
VNPPTGANGRGAVTGATRVAAVIGDPIRHSRSPQILNAAFDALGLDWVYVALPVASGRASDALEGMRTFGVAGLSVTMPHKTAVADHLEVDPDGELSDTARQLRAVNCVVADDGHLIGHNTDGAGFLASARADAGFDPARRRVAVLGAGGAARALVLALAQAGADEVVVINRTPDRAADAAALAGAAGRVGEPGDLSSVDLVVNATSVGMDGRSLPVDPAGLHAGQLVADIVMEPLDTPWLAAARAQGASTLDGLGMLVHQAAVALELWTGQPAPVDVMVRAAQRH